MAEIDAVPICQSQLRDRLVIDIETTEEVGRLDEFLIDIKNHQVEGFTCRQGLLGRERIPVMWVQIESIGQDSILVRRHGNIITQRFDQALVVSQQAIWTDSGNNVGHLVDYCIDLQTGAVTQYLFSAPGLQGLTDGVYTFQPEAVVSAGRKRMMVRRQDLEAAPQYVPGIQDRIANAFHQDFEQTRQDLQGIMDNSQGIAGQVRQQTKKLTEQTRSQFGQLFGEAKRRSKQLRAQVNDRVADVASTLQDNNSADQLSGTTIDVDSEAVWWEDEVPENTSENKSNTSNQED